MKSWTRPAPQVSLFACDYSSMVFSCSFCFHRLPLPKTSTELATQNSIEPQDSNCASDHAPLQRFRHAAASPPHTPQPRTNLGASPASTLAHRVAVIRPRGSISPRRAHWPRRCKRNCREEATRLLLGRRGPFPWQKHSGSAPHTRPAVCRDRIY